MTFKHIDFDDSPTMRSLVRVFQEKGLLKDEPIQKIAAPKFDLTPSGDLIDNLMKLCSGLRRSGFEKQAEELEGKFIQYKRANSLYNISGEDGEDLVHAAHPNGSHKMENIDSDEATFEDILDKHLKTLNVVNKQPTGKLASRDLIDAVGKVVLGDGAASFLARKKVAQEANKSPSTTGDTAGGVVGGIAGTAGFMGGVAGLKWLISKLISSGVDRQAVKFAEESLGRKLTSAEANVIIKQVVQKVGAKAIEDAVGKSALQSIEKTVATQVVERAVGQAVAEGATQAASGGLRSWLAGIAPAAWSAALTPVASASLGAIAGTTMIGLTLGGAIGYILARQSGLALEGLEDMIGVGDKIILELDSVDSELTAHEMIRKSDFSKSLGELKKLWSQKDSLTKNPSQKDIGLVFDFDDALRDSAQKAQNIWSIAQSHIEGNFLSRIYGSWSNIISYSDAYVKDANNIRTLFIRAMSEVREKADQVLNEQDSKSKTDMSAQLLKSYSDAAEYINRTKAKISSKKLSNAQELIGFLDKINEYIAYEKSNFEANKDPNKVSDFVNTFNNNIKSSLNDFKNEWKIS